MRVIHKIAEEIIILKTQPVQNKLLTSVAISSQTYKQVSDTSQRSNSKTLQVSDDQRNS